MRYKHRLPSGQPQPYMQLRPPIFGRSIRGLPYCCRYVLASPCNGTLSRDFTLQLKNYPLSNPRPLTLACLPLAAPMRNVNRLLREQQNVPVSPTIWVLHPTVDPNVSPTLTVPPNRTRVSIRGAAIRVRVLVA